MNYEPLENWRWDGYMGVRRKSPVRLNDRDAFGALLARFSKYQDAQPFMLSINEEDYDSSLPVDELMRLLPKRIVLLLLQSKSADFIVRLTSWQGGETWVAAPQRIDALGYESPLRSLVGLIESNSKPLGWRRHLSRARWPRRLSRYRIPVVERANREVLDGRQHDTRTAWIGGLSGLVAGILGSLLTVYLRK
jgi:hypothetical protein